MSDWFKVINELETIIQEAVCESCQFPKKKQTVKCFLLWAKKEIEYLLEEVK